MRFALTQKNSKTMNYPKHIANFFDNLGEVYELLGIHQQIAGTGTGRKIGVQTLNKSCIVLLTACWETFIEELISDAFDFLVSNAKSL